MMAGDPLRQAADDALQRVLALLVVVGAVHQATLLVFDSGAIHALSLAAVVWLAGTLLLARRGHTELAAHLANAGMFAFVTWGTLTRGALESTAAHIYALLLVMVAMTAGWRAVPVYGALVLVVLGSVPVLDAHGLIPKGQPLSQSHRLVTLFAFYVVFTALLLTYARRLSEAVRIRAEQEQALREKHAKLEASERQYARSIEQSPDGIVTLSASGVVEAVNPAAVEVLGYSRDEVLGHNFAELPVFPEGALNVAQGILSELARGIELPPFEFEVLRRDGASITLEVSTRPTLRDDGSRGIEATLRDVTERKRAETERRNLEKKLFRAQRLEALGRIASGVAHDFNNLLAVIRTNAHVIAERPSRADESAACAEEIIDVSGRASALTRQLLTFARKEVVAKRPVSINEVLESLRPMLATTLGGHIRLEMHLEATLRSVVADIAQLEQVVVNLAVNARDAMPSGGTLTVRTRREQLAPNTDGPPSLASGAYVVLEVADTGVGMDAETREHVFEPFFTTKESDGGTGLGLSMVHGIVGQSGGTIRIASEPGRGTRIEVLLPEVDAEPTPRAATPEIGKPTSAPLSVLVVEDDPAVRRSLQALLTTAGERVVVVSGPREAERIFQENPGDFDLLVTDLAMSGSTGQTLAKRLRSTRETLPVLFISGCAPEGLVLDERSAFLAKPFSPRVLLQQMHLLADPTPSTAAKANAVSR